jgi:hypothetical protein
MADKDELLNYADREAVEKAMKKLTLKDIDESAARTAKIEFEQENPIEVKIKKKPKKRSKKDEAILKAEKQRRARAKNKANPMGKKNGGVIKMKEGGFPDLTGDGKVTQADILKGKGVFKRGGSVNKKKIIRAAKRGFGAAKRGF